MKKNPNVYVIRSKPHNINREDQFLEGFASIGWPTDESLEGKNREEIEAALRPRYPWIKPLHVTQVDNFVHIPEGSIILSPSYRNRDIHIFRAVSGYRHVPEWADDAIGNPHVIDVELIQTVGREVFSKAVNNALKASRKPVTDFNKYAVEIRALIEGNPCGFDGADAADSVVPYDKAPIRKVSDDGVESAARQTLKELLNSSNEEVRLRAALALLGKGDE